MSQNLYHALSGGFPADRSATVFAVPGGRDVSFAELEAAAARMAALLHDLGLEPGDRVMAQVEKSPEAVCLYLACLRAGAIYLPLNTAYREAELDYFIADAEPSAIVCEPARAAAIEILAGRHGGARVLTLGTAGDGTLIERSRALEPATQIAKVSAEDIAAICYTSGTTGRSKGAMLSHGNLESNARTLHTLWGFVPGDVLLHALPIFHVHGLFVALHCAFLNGSTAIFLPRFDPDEMVRQMPNATVMMGVPTFYVRLLAHPGFSREACARMRLFIAGSAPLLAETFAEFEARTGHRVLERYGMTEAGMVTSNPYEGGERQPGKVGQALPGVEVRIADEDGTVLPPGEVGVLEYKGPNVFKGYWRMPEKTAEEFRADGFFISGDLATLDGDGTVTIVGRAKDLIISGGFNVYPKEVEGFIDELDGVGESAVVGLPHPDFGEAVTAVVTSSGAGRPDEAAIIAALKDRLAGFKVPKRVFVVEALPRNAMGKVQKAALRERYAGTFSKTVPVE